MLFRSRFRYLRGDWRYGIVKGGFQAGKDETTLDNAIREFSEEVMDFDDRDAFVPMNVKVHNRDVYKVHFQDSAELCAAI